MDLWKIISHDNKKSFKTLSVKRQHKLAADLLRHCFETNNYAPYRTLETWMNLPSVISTDPEKISHRFHDHLNQAGQGAKEHNLLISHNDRTSTCPFLPIAIILDHLRSAHNVGSIIRTTEAFRLGTLYFHGTTPDTFNAKVGKSSMGAQVPTQKFQNCNTLPRPILVLETTPNATPVQDFDFPESFTLILGNEEYGVSKELLQQADEVLQIPLLGSKNSLNVANAFAIVAYAITKKMCAHPQVDGGDGYRRFMIGSR